MFNDFTIITKLNVDLNKFKIILFLKILNLTGMSFFSLTFDDSAIYVLAISWAII